MTQVRVVATYQANEHERYQVAVTIPIQVDGLSEARTQAVQGVHDMLDDAIRQSAFAEQLAKELGPADSE